MVLVNLLLTEGAASRKRLLLGACGASLGSVALLAVVNLAAAQIARQSEDHVNWLLALLFVLAAGLYYLAENDLIRQVGAAMERAIDRVRRRLLERVAGADYAAIERFGSAALYESITQTTNALSQNSQFLALSLRCILLTAMVLVYILTLSPLAFVLVLAGTVAAGVMYARLAGQLGQRYAAMMGEEQQLFRTVGDLFDGFKEVRLSSARSQALEAGFAAISARSTVIRVEVQGKSFQKLIFGHVAFFFLLAVVVFVVPTYASGFASDVVQVSAAVIFMIGPLGGVIQAVTVMASANAAAEQMLLLDQQLAAMAEPGRALAADAAEATNDRPPAFAQQLVFSRVRYTYPPAAGERQASGAGAGSSASTAFGIGPIDLTLRRGEVVFITGGNGSGKSTFIKLLTGLYRPTQGHLAIDGQVVDEHNRRRYREHFAVVFSDPHLFRRLYGLTACDPEEVAQLLHWLEMERIVKLEDQQFSRTDLSSGQRKRVLLLAALLEHRPLLVLDEWAADQDPQFRRKFYREMVPELKARGITLIAVTHDDHYFDVADRRLHFEDGQMSERPIEKNEQTPTEEGV